MKKTNLDHIVELRKIYLRLANSNIDAHNKKYGIHSSTPIEEIEYEINNIIEESDDPIEELYGLIDYELDLLDRTFI